MASSPQNEGFIFLSQDLIDDKFEKLEILAHLNSTCNGRKTKPIVSSSLPSIQQRPRRSEWRGQVYTSKTDGTAMGLLYWRHTPGGDEERHVQFFVAQDGTKYMVDVVRFPDLEK